MAINEKKINVIRGEDTYHDEVKSRNKLDKRTYRTRRKAICLIYAYKHHAGMYI